MKWSEIENNWSEFKGKLRERYSDLSDEELESAKASRTHMLEMLETKYGKASLEAQQELENLMKGK